MISENERLSNLLQLHLQTNHSSLCGLTPILKKLLINAQQNAYKYPSQRRHSEIITIFATALFIYSGPFAYDFIHKNMQQGLPSPRSIQRAIYSQ